MIGKRRVGARRALALLAALVSAQRTFGQVQGPSSSRPPYVLPVAAGVVSKSILTVGDSVNLGPGGGPYRMVGYPDGLGGYRNGDGTFTLLMNHELGATQGVVHAHGSAGAFVSVWTIDAGTLQVMHGADLVQQVNTWNTSSSSYSSGTTAFARFCSGDLPASSAFFNAGTGLGTLDRIYLNGEEGGAEGRAFAHVATGPSAGASYQLPWQGRANWENAVACPAGGDKTIVIGLDDSSTGEIYVYVGQKGGAGSPVDRAGLTYGALYGVKVPGAPVESNANGLGAAIQPFTLYGFGNVVALSGATLATQSAANGVTQFQRPEDGCWDPRQPGDFYFNSTASYTTNSRLWRLRFTDITQPALGGVIEMLLSGGEGHKMLDNLTVDRFGHILLQEDPGDVDRLAKVWLYDIAADTLTEVAQANPAYFTVGMPNFLTRVEESSGIIDAAALLGPGWFLLDLQAHYSIADPELVQGGQLLALYVPQALPPALTIVAADPPLDNAYLPGVQPFRDVLETGPTAALTEGIGGVGTPAEATVTYGVVSVTFSGTTILDASDLAVICTYTGTPPGATPCATVTDVQGAGAGPYSISLSGPIPPGGCTMLTFANVYPAQAVRYESLPGDINMTGTATGQDLLLLVTAINDGSASAAGNLPRYDVNRNGAVTGQDALRLVQLLNGTNTTQAFNGATLAACP